MNPFDEQPRREPAASGESDQSPVTPGVPEPASAAGVPQNADVGDDIEQDDVEVIERVRRRRRVRIAVVAGIGVLALLVSGGAWAWYSGAGGQSAAKAPASARKFAACMRTNGVPDFPDPKPNTGALPIYTGKVDPEKLLDATRKCSHHLPNNGRPPAWTGEELAKARKFAACMRKNGVPDFPDPKPNAGAFDYQGDANRKTLNKAERACREYKPGEGS